MNEEKPIHIRSIGGFVKWVERLGLSGDALYRGMSSKEYDPDASIARRMEDLVEQKKPTEREMWKETIQLISGAKTEGYDRDPTRRGEIASNDFELLALLQHHGAATPLIDFSHNPLVALWFACADNHDKKKNGNGKVIAVNPADSNKIGTIDVRNHDINRQGIFELKKGKESVPRSTDESEAITQTGMRVRLWRFNPPGFDARILAQSSEFILGKTELEKSDIDAKCIIMKSVKAQIRQRLSRLYGISDKQLFRDLQGYAYTNAHDRPIEKKTVDEYKQIGMEYLERGEDDQAIGNFNKASGDE